MHAKSFQSCLIICNPMDCVAHQVPLSMGFSRQEYWSGLPCPPPGNLPNPGIEPAFLTSPALTGRFFTTSATWENPQVDLQRLKQALTTDPISKTLRHLLKKQKINFPNKN